MLPNNDSTLQNMPNEELVQSALDDLVEGVQRNSRAIPVSSSVSVSEDPLNAEVVHDAENDQMMLPNTFVSDITGNYIYLLSS